MADGGANRGEKLEQPENPGGWLNVGSSPTIGERLNSRCFRYVVIRGNDMVGEVAPDVVRTSQASIGGL